MSAQTPETQIAALQAEKDAATSNVLKIVNQPVGRWQRTAGMDVSVYSPGWFDDGATTPDFDNVDVRKTQELMYGNRYVTSDLNPGIVFNGSQLEFNGMTKYFYTDRTIPKKRLTEAEMLKINDLYRIIGRCNREIRKVQHPVEELKKEAEALREPEETAAAPESQVTRIHRYILAHKPAAIAGIGVLVVALVVFRLMRRSA